MAVSKQTHDDPWATETQSPEPHPRRESETSITARVVRSIAITMSATEMETLIRSFGKSQDELATMERIVQAEIVQAYESVS